MYCPACKNAYGPGHIRCCKCHVDLVSEPAGQKWFQGAKLRLLWKGDDQDDCTSICRRLAGAAIPYLVTQIPRSRYLKMAVYWRYEIRVAISCYRSAQNTLRADEISVEDQDYLERTTDFYEKKWRSKDAFVEVWCQPDRTHSPIIELSFAENLIHFRSFLSGDGRRRYLVLPQDEARARDIVHQIAEGTPPG